MTVQPRPTRDQAELREEIRPFWQDPGGENLSPTQNLPREPHGGLGQGRGDVRSLARRSPAPVLSLHLRSFRSGALGAARSLGRAVGGPRTHCPALSPAPSTEAQRGRRRLVQGTKILTNSAHFILYMQTDEGNETNDSWDFKSPDTSLQSTVSISSPKAPKQQTSLRLERKGRCICFRREKEYIVHGIKKHHTKTITPTI